MSAFIGRRVELQRIGELLRHAADDRRATGALILGDPGSGKSRLLAEALERSSLRRTMRLVGFEPTRLIPLASAADLIRWLAAVPTYGPRLDALVFGTTDPAARDPVRIFEAAHRALAAAGPAIVAVDDLHWLDELSVGLLLYLLRAAVAAGTGLAVVAAARPSPVAATFQGALDAVLDPGHRAVLELNPLSLDEGLALARSLDRRLDDTRAAELWRQAAGSPFWLEGLALARDGDIRTLIGQRLGRLAGDAVQLLAALTVGGRPYRLDDLAAVLGWRPARVLAAAHELAGRGVGVLTGDSLRIAHDLIREAAAREVPRSLRVRLHARFADVLERQAGDEMALLREALEHRVAGGDRGVDLALRLATSPQRRLLGRDGLLALSAIADSLPPGSEEQCLLDERLGEIAGALAEQDIAIGHWSRVADHAADPVRRRRALVEAGWAAYRRQDATTARAFALRARTGEADTPAAGDGLEERVRLETLEADTALWLDHRTDDGAAASDRALAGARRMAGLAGGVHRLSPPERTTYIASLEAAMDAALQQDRGTDVVELGEESLVAARDAEPEAYVAALNRVGFALGPVGRVAESERIYRQAWDLAQQLVLPAATVEAGHGLAVALSLLGRPRDARNIAAATMEVEARLTNAPRRWGHAAAILHEIELSLGDPSAALRALRQDIAHEPDPHFRLGIHETVAAWEARTRGPAAASAVAEHQAAAMADWELVRCPRCGRELAIITAELFARIGRADDARGQLAAWDRLVPDPSQQASRWRKHAAAMVLAADGRPREAIELLRMLAAEHHAGGVLKDRLWVMIDLGRLLESHDRDGAIEAYREAAALAERMGAVSQARLVAQALRRLGVRAWRRDATAGDDVLSARELEVGRMVAAGASNREIADALLIAPKTVERHVSNALTKLGIRNRTELAAWVRAPAGAPGAPAAPPSDARRRSPRPPSVASGTGSSR